MATSLMRPKEPKTEIDKTLTLDGYAADAKAVGDRMATLPEMEYGCFASPTTINTKDLRQYTVNFSNSHTTEPKTVLLSYRTYHYFYGTVHIATNAKHAGVDNTGFTFVYIPIEIGNGLAGIYVDWIAIW